MNRRIILLISLSLLAFLTIAQPTWKSCEASFTYLQDPGNYMIVNFTSTSTGDITDYFWDFGDGSTFHGENPSHAFPFAGEFTVCLTISGNDTLNPCHDSTCVPIRVDILPKYNVGGLLFAGNYPINNPLPTGDLAFAYLYRFEPLGLVPVDSIVFDTLGYFWFMGVTEGKYFLKTGLLEGSERFSQFLPAYHGDCLLWTDADTLFVEQNIYNVNIYMVEGEALEPGNGHISGTLMMEQSIGGTIPMKKGQVVLTDEKGKPYLCTYTDPSGTFLFDQLPPGEYKIFSEYTARYSQKIDVLLNEDNPSADSLELTVYASISGIGDMLSSDPFELKIFPNPVLTSLRVQFSLNQASQLLVSVYNLMGQRKIMEEWVYPNGNFQRELNLQYLPPGIYLIAIQDVHSGLQVTRKIIKK